MGISNLIFPDDTMLPMKYNMASNSRLLEALNSLFLENTVFFGI
jgi:hypothetical protein